MRSLPSSFRAADFAVAALFFTFAVGVHAQETLRIDLGGGTSLEAVRIEAGSFQQGLPANVVGRNDDETQRKVTLTRPFFLGKFPVTRGQFARFVEETRFRTDAETGTSGGFGWDGAKLVQRKDFTWKNPGFPQTDAHPVTIVTYKDAEAFTRWLSRKSGRTFALPSEAQWEYAALAGGKPASDAWHKDNSAGSTHPVGEKSVNAWGVGDMLGNVWEWCEDWYAPYNPGDATDPIQRNQNLSDKPRRVLRGGSWLREPKFCRPAARYRNDALSRNADNGFRVMTFDMEARSVAPPPVPAKPPIALEAPDVAAHSAPHFETHPVAPEPERRSMRWLLAIPIVGVFMVFAFMVFRAIARAFSGNGGSGVGSGFAAASRLSGAPLRVRLGEDGFWIVGDGITAGALIACSYMVNGNSEKKTVRYEPGPDGQFVFTGSRPTNVSVSTSSGGSSDSTSSRRFGNAIGMGSTLHDDPPFRGHPPAY